MSSKGNPFQAFAAGGGGWFTTKRKGKDDDQIEHDKRVALQARKNARGKSNNATKKPAKKKPKKKAKRKEYYDSEEEDLDFIVDSDEEIEQEAASDSEDEVVPMLNQKRKAKRKSETVDLSLSDEDEEMDDDELFSGSTFGKRSTAASASMNKGAAQKRATPFSDASNRKYSEEKKSDDVPSSSDESESELLRTGSRHFQSKNKTLADSDSDDDDIPTKSSSKKRSSNYAFDDSSDEDIPTKSHNKVFHTDDFVEDDDEANAISWVLHTTSSQTSPLNERKRLKKKKQKKKKAKRQVTLELSPDTEEGASPEDGIDELLMEESSNDEEEQDAYNDEEQGAKEALSVLNATNQLSRQVVQAMTGWSAEKDGDTIPDGIIADGALAMLDCTQSNASSHSWISQETMQKVCPHVKLADYQLIGVNWLALLHGLTCDVDGKKGSTNVNGVLADEMGLGKTVQTIAFLAWLRHHNRKKNGYTETNVIDLEKESEQVTDVENESADGGKEQPSYARPHIIVVPASVLSNWQREFETFCPDMNVIKYHGSMSERGDLQSELEQYLPSKSGGVRPNAGPALDVVLTTYSYFSGENSDDRRFLKKFNFDYLVVDEAHCLKNPRGQRYRNLDKLETSHRLLLTGTPVQNSPQELMSLLCFLMPLFSRSKGGFDYGDDGKNDGGESMLQHFVSLESSGLSEDDASEAAYRKLKQLFAPFVLRRRKVDALKQLLPEKTHSVELVPFDDSTRSVYDSILADHIRKKENGAAAQQHLFTALRKAANHPLLLRTRHTSEEAKSHLAKCLFQYGYFGRDATCTIDHVRRELENFSDFDLHCAALELIEENKFRRDELGRYILDQAELFSSPKFVRLRTLLPDLIKKGHRILIFSQWKICMDLLACLMETLNLEFLRLDGSTKIAERQTLIDTFNTDSSIPVFLLSTRAGGMGINLTSADVCIIHDLDFNPFNDIQAEDRIHRIGQTKPVQVIKMVTKETVDADIYALQKRKAKMNAAILESGGSAKNKAEQKKEEERTKIGIVQSAVNRFVLTSPPPTKNSTKEEATDS